METPHHPDCKIGYSHPECENPDCVTDRVVDLMGKKSLRQVMDEIFGLSPEGVREIMERQRAHLNT